MTPSSRILVVEDEPVIAALLEQVLGRAGHRVAVAHRVADALELVEAGAFDLCISDFLLPDLTGLVLARRLGARRPGLRVILMSAYLEPDVAAAVRAEPAVVAILQKPMNVLELLELVQRHASLPAEREAGC